VYDVETQGAPIATADEILKYMGEVIDENDLARHIRYNHTISTATWSGDEKRWTIDAVRTDRDQPVRFTCSLERASGVPGTGLRRRTPLQSPVPTVASTDRLRPRR